MLQGKPAFHFALGLESQPALPQRPLTEKILVPTGESVCPCPPDEVIILEEVTPFLDSFTGHLGSPMG